MYYAHIVVHTLATASLEQNGFDNVASVNQSISTHRGGAKPEAPAQKDSKNFLHLHVRPLSVQVSATGHIESLQPDRPSASSHFKNL